MNIGLPIYQPPTKIKIKRRQNGKVYALFEFKDRRKYLHHPGFIFQTPIGKGENMQNSNNQPPVTWNNQPPFCNGKLA